MSDRKRFNIYKPEEIGVYEHDLKGEEYKQIIEKVTAIVHFQRKHSVEDGIKGFIFHGEVGTGKTITAKVLSAKLGSYLIFIDGSDIARTYYGESEQQIATLFKEALNYPHSIILIDDCESVFPKRDWLKGEAWHVAQNNVFFHRLDDLNTAKTIVILTTNRYDLIDKAIKDRLYPIEYPLPSKETIREIAIAKCRKLKMPPDAILEYINGNSETFKTIRTLEKLIIEKYIEYVTKRI